MCMITTPARVLEASWTMPGSPLNPVTSLTMWAPASRAAWPRELSRCRSRELPPAPLGQVADDWENAVQFLGGWYLPGAGPGGLSSHVDDGGTFAQHSFCMQDGRIDVKKAPPSEKESGVTLRMPMRMPASGRGRRRSRQCQDRAAPGEGWSLLIGWELPTLRT